MKSKPIRGKPRLTSNLYTASAKFGHPSKTYYLLHDHETNGRIVYAAYHMPIYDHERNLDAGRFKHFTKEPRPHSTSILLDQGKEDFFWFDRVSVLINWIAEHVESPWSLHVDMDHATKGTFIFSFDDPVKGVLFKLVFS